MPLKPPPRQLVWGRPRHRRRRPSAGGSEAGPMSGSVPPPLCGACKWPPWRAGASGMGAPEAAQHPSPARRARHMSPPPAAAVDRRPKESGLRTRAAPGNRPSRPAAATNRPQRGRRRQRRRQPPPPPGGRRPQQAGGFSSTAAAVASSASCGRPAGAAAAARDGGGRRRRGGYGATRPCARALDALRCGPVGTVRRGDGDGGAPSLRRRQWRQGAARGGRGGWWWPASVAGAAADGDWGGGGSIRLGQDERRRAPPWGAPSF